MKPHNKYHQKNLKRLFLPVESIRTMFSTNKNIDNVINVETISKMEDTFKILCFKQVHIPVAMLYGADYNLFLIHSSLPP